MIHMERASDGDRRPLAVHDWVCPATSGERRLLSELRPAVLDVGCGPGRLAAALAECGRAALGIDVSPSALRSASAAGAVVLERSIFDPLPGEGRWSSVLLMDGNVGIGGDPVRLLTRIGELLAADGEAVVEVDPPGSPTEADAVRLRAEADEPGPWFDWAWVGADAMDDLAERAGFGRCEVQEVDGRFVARVGELRVARRRGTIRV